MSSYDLNISIDQAGLTALQAAGQKVTIVQAVEHGKTSRLDFISAPDGKHHIVD